MALRSEKRFLMDAQLGMRSRQVEVADRPLTVWEEFDVSMSPGMLVDKVVQVALG